MQDAAVPITDLRRRRGAKARTGRSNPARAFLLPAVLLAILLLGIGTYLWRTVPAPETIGGPFRLIDGAGHSVSDADFHGKFMLVYFGYTFCPDVCPTTLNQVALAMDRLGARAGRVQPLFITVDPQRDTPDVIGRYVAAFGPRLIGLTGMPDAIAAVVREYRVYAGTPQAAEGGYTVDHSSILYLMGPDGRFVAAIPAAASGEAIAAAIAGHLS